MGKLNSWHSRPHCFDSLINETTGYPKSWWACECPSAATPLLSPRRARRHWHLVTSAGPLSAFPGMGPRGAGHCPAQKAPLGPLIIVHFIKETRASKGCGFMGRDLDGSHYSCSSFSPLGRCLHCLPFSPRLISCLCFLLSAGPRVHGELAIVAMVGGMGEPFEPGLGSKCGRLGWKGA